MLIVLFFFYFFFGGKFKLLQMMEQVDLHVVLHFGMFIFFLFIVGGMWALFP